MPGEDFVEITLRSDGRRPKKRPAFSVNYTLSFL